MKNINLDQLFINQGFWSQISPFNDIVFSSHLNLKRNIYDIPFPFRQAKVHLEFLVSVCRRFVKESRFAELEFVSVNKLDNNSRMLLKEKNLISHDISEAIDSFIIFDLNENFYLTINDNDHFTINVLRPGFQPVNVYRTADEIDDELNKFAAYAYSEESGYITSSPFYNNSFQISIMLHLPALALTRNIKEIQDIAKINRLNLSGLKDEGIKTFGSIFTLSNEFCTETSEEKIIETVEKITRKIIKFESETRENYLAEHSERLEDRICRSYGLLKYARRMGYVEAMDYLSDIRLGVILSIIRNLELQKVNDLMRNIQWAHLQNIAKKNFSDSKDGDAFRASYLRNQLEWSKVYG
ncbi:MAG: hypothetical protein JW864_12900 [Spirochaetes bacterium]|nr:hypothetical protein [Spirochaetota bacterium]